MLGGYRDLTLLHVVTVLLHEAKRVPVASHYL